MSVHETPCPSLTEHAARALSEDDERAEPLWAFVLRVEREWEAEQADPITASKAWMESESELRAAFGDR